MKKTLFLTIVLALLVLLSTSTVFADKGEDDDYPWRDDRKAPFVFEFGNMIDTHQQSKLKKEELKGYIYIHYTGEYTEDGIPMARKADCYNEECSIGWVIKGIPYQAILVNTGPRIWLIDSSDPLEAGYTHFQWEGNPKKPHGLILNNTYEGYLLRRVAVTTFYWLGGNGQGGNGGGGGCSGDDHTDGGCSGEEHADGGSDMGSGCSGDDHTGGGGSSGHGGRLVVEGFDAHTNVVTNWDGTWHGGSCDD